MSQKPECNLWQHENSLFERGVSLICGCDEAGAGPLAGPVYAAAVILPRGLMLPYLNDSKKVTPKRRDILFDEICREAVAYGIASVSAEEIDRIDILNARMLAMQRAMDQLDPPPEMALVDGNRDHGSTVSISTPHVLVVDGDAQSASIAAASILAKVSRDRYMVELAKIYPDYGFEKHKGYGTKAHYAALDDHGPCPAHRRSFLKKWESRRG